MSPRCNPAVNVSKMSRSMDDHAVPTGNQVRMLPAFAVVDAQHLQPTSRLRFTSGEQAEQKRASHGEQQISGFHAR